MNSSVNKDHEGPCPCKIFMHPQKVLRFPECDNLLFPERIGEGKYYQQCTENPRIPFYPSGLSLMQQVIHYQCKRQQPDNPEDKGPDILAGTGP